MRNLEARILPVDKARDPSTGWGPRGVPGRKGQVGPTEAFRGGATGADGQKTAYKCALVNARPVG
ncbi:MAG: hypothetical protein ACE5GG_06060 [Candidatus Omnitrophota bacterium]